jgi:hypothetical protein
MLAKQGAILRPAASKIARSGTSTVTPTLLLPSALVELAARFGVVVEASDQPRMQLRLTLL